MVARLSSNVDGHVLDNYLLILCSMPLTIIVRLVFNIKKTCYEQHDMFINTLSGSQSCLLSHRCIHTHIGEHYVTGILHPSPIIANIIIDA